MLNQPACSQTPPAGWVQPAPASILSRIRPASPINLNAHVQYQIAPRSLAVDGTLWFSEGGGRNTWAIVSLISATTISSTNGLRWKFFTPGAKQIYITQIDSRFWRYRIWTVGGYPGLSSLYLPACLCSRRKNATPGSSRRQPQYELYLVHAGASYRNLRDHQHHLYQPCLKQFSDYRIPQ